MDYHNTEKIEKDFTTNQVTISKEDSLEEDSLEEDSLEVVLDSEEEEEEREKFQEEEREKFQEEREREREEIENKVSYKYTDVILALFLSSAALFCFLYFLDFKTNSKMLWEKYFSDCCTFLHNETRCKLTTSCQDKLIVWLNLNNKSLDLLNKCCYWYAPITEYRIYSTSYCFPGCF